MRARVIGVAVTAPVLTNDARQEFPSPTPALLIWVEAQSLTTTGISPRRWQNPLNDYATLIDATGARINPAKLPPGSRVGGQLEGGHSLPPGGASVVDILAFDVPAGPPQAFRLELTATHVAESGSFVIGIPSTALSR